MGIDESTTIKNPAAKRTKNILSLSKLTKYRRILNRFTCNKITFRFILHNVIFRSLLLDQSSYYVFRTRYAVCRKINVSGRSVEYSCWI